MNIARTISTIRCHNVGKNFMRMLKISASNHDSPQTKQVQKQEDKFDFEDLKVLERIEHKRAPIPPFMKDVFVSIFNRDLLAFPEVMNKEDSDALELRVTQLNNVFSDARKTREDRIDALKNSKMYAAPVSLTHGGLAMNYTESLSYLETIASDLHLAQQLSDHWVGLQALRIGLDVEQYQKIIDDLIHGDKTIALCIKEKVAERITQADFRTKAELDMQGVWHITGEKVCRSRDGYFFVLCAVEADRLMAFLVHPGAPGISHSGSYVNFHKTPATPLDRATESQLAHALGASRLYAAVLCRTTLTRALQECTRYVQSRVFNGKPLSDLSSIRLIFGDALVDIYASESAEYFTAGLLDGYQDADAEMEMAMCRNFTTRHGMTTLLPLLAVPALEMPEQSAQLLDDMRHLTLRGETLDSVDMFIALNGIHHAGKVMAKDVKEVRNPLFHPLAMLKRVVAYRDQEKDDPKLTLYLAEHLHPSLRVPSEQLEYCVLRMKYACETLMCRHGASVATAYTELSRLSEAATLILMMTSVLARASRSYCIGLRNAELEMKLAACFVEKNKDRVKRLIREIDDGEYLNLDHYKVHFGQKVLDHNSTIVERPTARVFW